MELRVKTVEEAFNSTRYIRNARMFMLDFDAALELLSTPHGTLGT
jgi:hypothetical protein